MIKVAGNVHHLRAVPANIRAPPMDGDRVFFAVDMGITISFISSLFTKIGGGVEDENYVRP